MSRPFNDTTNLSGLVQKYEQEIGVDPGVISGNTVKLKQFTSATRSAWDMYIYLALKASGTWQFDDTNHQDGSGNYTYSIIKTNLVQGQRDYTFLADEGGNLILDIYKVAILPSSTEVLFQELTAVDEFQGNNDILAENTAQGIPSRYAKLANGIQFDTPTSYNATNGLKLYIGREASYFDYQDTTKKPGCPGIHHDYFALKPAYEHARRNKLANVDILRNAVVEFEGDEKLGIVGSIERYFGRRNRDERKVITNKKINYI